MTRRPGHGLALGVLLALAACSSGGPSETQPAGTIAGGSPSAAPTASASGSPLGSPAPSTPPTAVTYTVQAGDTLVGIGRRFGVSVDLLRAWNAARYPELATQPDVLRVGWELAISGDPAATLPPVARPTPTPSRPPTTASCSAGDRVAAGSQQVFRTVPNAGNAVALTFDMGGRIDPAVEIMSFLVENQVCATIFPTGVMSQTPEGQQVMAIIRAHPELFELGNHTMHHCNLQDGGGGSPSAGPCPAGRQSAAFIQRQLTDAAAVLRQQTGQDAVPYWRPPYGAYDQGVLDAAAAVGYTKTFMWDIDTVDWKPVAEGGPTAAQIASKVVNSAVGGSNVLMHLGGWNTLDALPSMVSGLRARGFLLTSLSDLLQ